MRFPCVLVSIWVLWATAAAAQSPATPTPVELQKQIHSLQQQMQQMMVNYQDQIDALQRQVTQLLARQSQAAQTAQASQEEPISREQGLLPPAPAAPPSTNLANPAISLIPDFTYAGGNDPSWNAGDGFKVREVEIAFSANIDPYAKAFAALSMEGGEFEVEEAYAAFSGLPGGWTLKLGKFYADFGKTNGLHTHSWFQADKPLALRTMLGEEPFSDVGVSASHLLPTPWMSDLTLEVTGGRSAEAFGGQRSDLAYLAAWRNFWDLGERSNLEAQISLTTGRNATGHGTGLGNLAVTYRFKVPGAKADAFLWRTEVLWETYRTHYGIARSRGAFSYLDWQFKRGWSLGARADYAEHPMDPRLHDRGGALVMTYYPSEFQKFRLQVERINYAEFGARNAVIFEYGFSIGPHSAHPF